MATRCGTAACTPNPRSPGSARRRVRGVGGERTSRAERRHHQVSASGISGPGAPLTDATVSGCPGPHPEQSLRATTRREAPSRHRPYSVFRWPTTRRWNRGRESCGLTHRGRRRRHIPRGRPRPHWEIRHCGAVPQSARDVQLRLRIGRRIKCGRLCTMEELKRLPSGSVIITRRYGRSIFEHRDWCGNSPASSKRGFRT
jgi:hypothetical protein